MRVFVALDLPRDISAELLDLQMSLAIGKPVAQENFHLTLCFLGEQPDERIEEAHLALSGIRAPVFDLQLSGVGSFGHHSPKAVFAEVAPCEELRRLEQKVTRSLRAAGLTFQKRRFSPHVTLARLPKVLSIFELNQIREFLEVHSDFRGSHFQITRFQLYQSVLTPKAAVHEGLASYELAAW